MAIPVCDPFIAPLLRLLGACTAPIRASETCDRLADAVGLTEEERAERLPSGAQAIYRNRIGWAHDRLKRSDYSSSPARGQWMLTEAGRVERNYWAFGRALEILAARACGLVASLGASQSHA